MKRVLCLVLVGMLASVASADLLVNGGFETPVISTPNTGIFVSDGTVTGWSVFSGTSAKVGNYTGLFQKTGNNFAYLSSVGLIAQIVQELQPNTTYTLTVDTGCSSSWNGYAHQSIISLVEMTSTGNYVSTLAYKGQTTDPSNPRYIDAPDNGDAYSVTVDYTTGASVTAGNHIGVLMGFNLAPDLGYGAIWDNAVLTAVPEPATMCLLGFGGLAGLIRRRK